MRTLATPPRRPVLALLCLCGLALFSAPALAALTEPEQPAANGSAPVAGRSNLDVKAALDAAKAAEARENAASRSIEDMLNKAQAPAPAASPAAQPRRGGKVIYGDIIIHK